MLESETRAILETLIAFDTTSRNSNLALIAWVEAFLHARGIATERVASEDGAKANLYALIGPAVEGGVVLSGHTDVVPVDGQPWSSDPWTLTERDGKVFGRGVADMKSFLALSLAHVDAMRSAALKRPIILAFSYDEEVGCLGVHSLIARMADIMPKPAAVIVGEPSEMKVVSAHKGIRTYRVEIEGREAHSSQIAQGVSAVMEALPLMQLVAEMGQDAWTRGDPTLFHPPGPTMTVGVIQGGTAANILARRCEFIWDLRCPPGVDPDEYEQRFRDAVLGRDAAVKLRAPEAFVRVTRRSDTPSFAPEPGGDAELLARALTGDNDTRTASYAAEAGLFQRAGYSTVICGPGAIAQAHQPDEWITLDQLAQGADFMKKLIARLSA